MTLNQNTIMLGALGVGVGLAAYVLLRGSKGVAKDAVGAVTGIGEGLVLGVGEAVGIPETNVAQGRQDVANGDWWSASFNLPAGEFIGSVWDHLTGKGK